MCTESDLAQMIANSSCQRVLFVRLGGGCRDVDERMERRGYAAEHERKRRIGS